MCAKFQQKLLINYFSDKIPGFSQTIELCLVFCMGFCITKVTLPNYKKNQSMNPNFILTTLKYNQHVFLKYIFLTHRMDVLPYFHNQKH